MLFDKDGTLCRSDGFLSALAQARALCCAELTAIQASANPCCRAYGLRNGQLDPSGSTAVASRHDNLISTATVLAAAGHSWGQARQWAQAALDQADAQLAGSKAQRTPPLPGLKPVLERWHRQGLKLAVISSDLGPSLEAFLHYPRPAPSVLCGPWRRTQPPQTGSSRGPGPVPRTWRAAPALRLDR